MATSTRVHTKRLSPTHVRELSVAYDKGGINYWDYSQKPKGIYFTSALYQDAEGSDFRIWSTGQRGDGYILVVPLDRYRPKPLKEVRARVLAHAEALARLKAILAGTATPDAAPAAASTPAA